MEHVLSPLYRADLWSAEGVGGVGRLENNLPAAFNDGVARPALALEY